MVYAHFNYVNQSEKRNNMLFLVKFRPLNDTIVLIINVLFFFKLLYITIIQQRWPSYGRWAIVLFISI